MYRPSLSYYGALDGMREKETKKNNMLCTSRQIPELLAPAGSQEMLVAAIAAGADAVYLSGKQYGARSFAQNFDEKELCTVIKYAHLHGVRVYVTVNTLMHDAELASIEAYLLFLAQVGADAVIVQDIGVLSLARSIVPTLQVHASTQMSIHTIAGALWAKKHGCTRVILARELSKRDITAISTHPDLADIGIEIFGHGALCFAYSGQCLLSSVMGGRSGNRGTCAQPCRKRYHMVPAHLDRWGRPCPIHDTTAEGSYLLSTRDLCIYPALDCFLTIPIVSIKIEGRMRSPKYVATVVSIYRHALDTLARGSFPVSQEDELALRLAYSRDFTIGYGADAPPSSIMQPVHMKHPGNSGIYIGTIQSVDSKNIAYIKQIGEIELIHGDGLSIYSTHDTYGTTLTTKPRIRDGHLEIPVPKEARPGDTISLTSRPEIMSRYESLITEHHTRPRHVHHINAMVTIHPSGSLDINATLITPHHTLSFSYESKQKLLPAQKHELKGEDLQKQIQRSKNTPFQIHSTIVCPPGLFAPIKIQNEIRRELLSYATESLHHAYERSLPYLSERTDSKTTPSRSRQNTQIIVLQSEYTKVKTEATHLRYISWHALRTCLHSDFNSDTHDMKSLGVSLPVMTPDSDLALMEEDFSLFTGLGITKYLVHTLGQAEWIRSHVPHAWIAGYLGLNITNQNSISMLEEYSFLTLSGELSGEQIQKLSRYSTVPLAVVVQGTMGIGVTKNFQSIPWSTAPAFALQDAKKCLFRVLPDGTHETIIYNTDELTLIDQVSKLVSWGIEYLIIDARGRSAAYVEQMLFLYTQAVRGADPVLLMPTLQQIVLGRCTIGAWNRGL
ncbi:MAG: U32 family peptidase [Methanomicrobiales archaeon]|jgi:putative protease|nr:U32 family peptidase [Methanomicrobiales archaeon]